MSWKSKNLPTRELFGTDDYYRHKSRYVSRKDLIFKNYLVGIIIYCQSISKIFSFFWGANYIDPKVRKSCWTTKALRIKLFSSIQNEILWWPWHPDVFTIKDPRVNTNTAFVIICSNFICNIMVIFQMTWNLWDGYIAVARCIIKAHDIAMRTLIFMIIESLFPGGHLLKITSIVTILALVW